MLLSRERPAARLDSHLAGLSYGVMWQRCGPVKPNIFGPLVLLESRGVESFAMRSAPEFTIKPGDDLVILDCNDFGVDALEALGTQSRKTIGEIGLDALDSISSFNFSQVVSPDGVINETAVKRLQDHFAVAGLENGVGDYGYTLGAGAFAVGAVIAHQQLSLAKFGHLDASIRSKLASTEIQERRPRTESAQRDALPFSGPAKRYGKCE